jgi:hypothetical protein
MAGGSGMIVPSGTQPLFVTSISSDRTATAGNSPRLPIPPSQKPSSTKSLIFRIKTEYRP